MFVLTLVLLTVLIAAAWFARGGLRTVLIAGAGALLLYLLVVWALVGDPRVLQRHTLARNEGAAIQNLREVMSAEHKYAEANGGAYGSLSCLAAPTSCGFAAETTPFIDLRTAALVEKQGYRHSFIAGIPKVGTVDSRGMASFAYVATPIESGRTGRRGFCGDDSGLIRFSLDGAATPVANGRCRSDSPVLK